MRLVRLHSKLRPRSTSCTRRRMTARLLIASILCAVPAMAIAQETRAGSIAAEQADKATHLAPYEPHWAENLLSRAGQTLVEQPGGFYPYFDSVYSGGGFTLGAGYRHFTGDRTQWSVAGLYSVKGYKLIEASAISPGHLSGHLDLHGTVSWRDATRVAYHGLGIDSPADAGTAFRMQQAYVGADVTARPHRWLPLTAAASYEDYTLKDPTGGFAPVEGAFTPEAAPGVGANPVYVHTTASAAFDWRPAADYARRGGLYQIAGHHYADQDGVYSFDRLDAEVVQHIPILRENWVISLRGRRADATLDDNDQVPYFLLPSLGSGSTLRAYSSWRFRDRHACSCRASGGGFRTDWRSTWRSSTTPARSRPTGDATRSRRLDGNFGIGVRFHAPARHAAANRARERDRGHHTWSSPASAAF